MSKKLKKTMAAVLAGALVFSMLPAAGPKTAEAAEPPKPTAHYDMSHSENQLTDVSGNKRHATLYGTSDSDFKTGGDTTILQFEDNDNNPDVPEQYAELPRGLVTGTDNNFTVEITLSTSTKAAQWAWCIGQGVGTWEGNDVGNYVFVNPMGRVGDREGEILAGIKVGSPRTDEIRLPSPSKNLGAGYGTITLVGQDDKLTLYLDGEVIAEETHRYKMSDIVPEGNVLGYIGKSLWEPDPLLTANVGDIKFYDVALTQEEVAASMPTAEEKMNMLMLDLGVDTSTSTGNLTSDLIASYDMSRGENVLTDVSGKGNDAPLVDADDSDFVTYNGDTVWQMKNDGYAKLPYSIVGDFGDSTDFTVQATLTTQTQAAHWLFALGNKLGAWQTTGDYIFVNPSAIEWGGSFLGGINNGGESRINNCGTGMGDVNGYGTVTLVGRGGVILLYLDGELMAYTNQSSTIQDVLADINANRGQQNVDVDDEVAGYIGRSLYKVDDLLTANLADFKIWSCALGESDIAKTLPTAEQKSNLLMADIPGVVKAGNENLSTVTDDLNLAASVDNVALTWGTWEETDVIDTDGTVSMEITESKTVTLPFSYEIDGQKFENSITVTVLPPNVQEELETALASIDIPNKDDVRGNITLPEESVNGIAIKWSTDRSDIVNVNAIPATVAGYDDTPAGTVTRPANDTVVTMTATLTLNGQTVTKDIPIRVKAAPEEIEEEDYTDYFFAYFVGQNAADEEQIYFASSQNGLNWTELNNNEPVLTSTLGELGVRDPFIMRSAEGDKFYLIATDLSIYRNGDWTRAQNSGSQCLMVWESTDLVNWSEQRMVEVSASIGAGCTWAPEITYDELTGEYVVYWASRTPSVDNKQRVYYAKTRDFYTFTDPQVFIDYRESNIDTTIIYDEEDQLYYRFTKNEAEGYNEFGVPGKTVYVETSDTLLGGNWTFVQSDSLNSNTGVEGPSIFKFNEDDQANGEYCLLVDNYGRGGYYPLVTNDISSAVFTSPGSYDMPSGARHGTPIRITAAEYARVMQQYGGQTVDNSELQAAIESAESAGYAEADYTAVSWEEFSDALAYAKEILEKGTAATAAEVSAALRRLDSGRQGLVPANRETLVSLVADANAELGETDKYTEASLANLAVYIDAAEAVLDNSASTPAQIQTAIDKLNQALADLDEKEQGGQTGDGDQTGDGGQTGDGSQNGDKDNGGQNGGKDTAGQTDGNDKAVQTGDTTNLLVPAIIAVIALAAAAAVIIIRKKRK